MKRFAQQMPMVNRSMLYRRWAAKLPDPRTLPYAVRLAQRALEQADYGLWQLQGILFQLIN